MCPLDTVVGLQADPTVQVDIQVYAPVDGLQKLVFLDTSNCTVYIPSFPPGTTEKVVSTVTKTDPSKPAHFELLPTGQNGYAFEEWPVVTKVKLNTGNWVQQAFTGVDPGSGGTLIPNKRVTVFNGDPGLGTVTIEVNGKTYQKQLQPGEIWKVKVAEWKGSKSVLTLKGQGDPGAGAIVAITDRKKGVVHNLPVAALLASQQNLVWGNLLYERENNTGQRSASVSSQSVELAFASMLNLSAAGDPKRYRVEVNGRTLKVASVESRIVEEGVRLTLHLPSGSLKHGDRVMVYWDELLDALDHQISGQAGPMTAK